MDYDLIVIGAGAAGLSVASGAAQLGVKTALIERDRLGGDCLYYGCVPSKTLIHAAKLAHQSKTAKEYGITSTTDISFTKVIAKVQSVIKSISRHDAESRFQKMGVNIIKGTAIFVDKHTIEVNGKHITAKKFVIATGSSPRELPIPGLKETGYLTNIDVFTLTKQPKSLIIIGGGPIACELGQSFQRLGTQVVMIVRSRLLSKEDSDVSLTIKEVFQNEKITVIENTKIKKVTVSGEKKCIYLEHNDKPMQIKAEEIVVATGRQINLKHLNLEAAGVEYSERGLTVNKRLQTSQKHIYGCGDVTGQFLFTHAASYEAGIIIRNAVFHLPSKVNYTTFPWVTYTDPEVAHVGKTEKELENQPYQILKQEFKNNDRAETESHTTGFAKVLHRKGKILGVTIVGANAGEMLPEFTVAIKNNLKLKAISTTIHPYPTLSEINKRTTDQYFSNLLFSRKTKKILKLLFNYRGDLQGETTTLK